MSSLDALPGDLSAALAQGRDVEAACEATTACLQDAGVRLSSIYLPSGGLLRCLGVRGYGQLFDGIPPGVGVIGKAFASGRRLHVRATTDGDGYRAAAQGVVEELALPLHVRGQCVGVLNIESTCSMSTALVQALDASAQVLSATMARLGGPPSESPAQQLVRHATVLSEAQDLPELSARLLDAARALSSLDTAALVSGRGPRLLAAAGPQAESLQALPAAALGELLPWVRHGVSSRTSGQRGLQPSPVQELLESSGLLRFVLVPVVSQQELFAVLVVGDGRREPVPPGTVEVLELLAALGAADLRSMRSAQQLRQQARTDPLTGLPHRRGFDELLRQSLLLAPSQPGTCTAVALIDLDRFKEVNDARGHPAGDEVLRSSAAVLSTALRSLDVLHRIGGDEFAAVLEVHDLGELQAVADRMVLAARQSGTTVSIGGCLARAGEEPQSVVDRADAALYAAKAEGRDRACVVDADGAGA